MNVSNVSQCVHDVSIALANFSFAQFGKPGKLANYLGGII